MPVFARFSAVIALLALPAVAENPSSFADIAVAESAVTIDALPQAEVVVGGITVLPDVAYSILPGHTPLRLDIYQAPGTPAPLVVFVHGGGWTIGTKRATAVYADFPATLARFAQGGISVASVEYRLSHAAPFPAAVDDIRAAVRFLRQNHARFGIDPDRIALWGA